MADAKDGDTSKTDETDEPKISVHAITDIRTSETMQVRVQLGSTSLLALIDSGSTHNFVAKEAATHTSLQLLPKGKM